jgi:hypothetical protein
MRFLTLLFTILLFEACERVTYDRYELTYPKTFVFDEITTQPSRFRFSGSNLMDTIPPVTFSSFPDSAAAWLADGRFEPPFETIEILSDTSARISGGALASELTIPSIRRDANQGIFFDLKFATETGQDSIKMAIWDGSEHLSLESFIYQYTYRPFQPPFQIMYSPILKRYESSVVPDLVTYLILSSDYDDDVDTLAYKSVTLRYR